MSRLLFLVLLVDSAAGLLLTSSGGGLRGSGSIHATAPFAAALHASTARRRVLPLHMGKKAGKPKGAKAGGKKQQGQQEKASVQRQRQADMEKQFIFTILKLEKTLPDGSRKVRSTKKAIAQPRASRTIRTCSAIPAALKWPSPAPSVPWLQHLLLRSYPARGVRL